MSDDPVSGAGVKDSVVISWSGVPCQLLDGGKRALCQIGSAGSPGIFDILMDANDGGVTPPFDNGSRDDPLLQFGISLTGIWVSITPNFDGQFDVPDNKLTFLHERMYPHIDDANPTSAGQTTPGPTSWGFFSKTELIGTILPLNAADGKATFQWKQDVFATECAEDWLGNWTKVGDSGGWVEDPIGTEGVDAQGSPTNSKIYLIDAPGPRVGPNNNWGTASYARYYVYQDFKTHVEWSGTRASNDFMWHVVTKITAAPTENPVWTREVPTNVGIGLMENRPNADCSLRP